MRKLKEIFQKEGLSQVVMLLSDGRYIYTVYNNYIFNEEKQKTNHVKARTKTNRKRYGIYLHQYDLNTGKSEKFPIYLDHKKEIFNGLFLRSFWVTEEAVVFLADGAFYHFLVKFNFSKYSP